MWQCGSVLMSGKKLSDAAVQHFHQQLNAGQYEEIYNEADDGFRSGETHENIVKFLEAVHKKLGNSRDTDFVNIGVNATTNGTFTTTIYNTTFDGGPSTETFTWVKSSGNLKLYSYHIESKALIMN
jgi:hypothetical protein